MERLGHLRSLYTAYPLFKVDGLPREKVRTLPWLMGASYLLGRLGLTRTRDRINAVTIESFDRWMASRLEPCDVFHCLSSFGAASHRAARERYGALTVCDRGSSHILFQDDILRNEYERVGIPYSGIDPRTIERELAEYEFCDLVTVPSTFAMRSFIEKGVDREKLRLNSYGVDLGMFHPMPKRDCTFRVLFVGAISIRKGVPYLLEAVKQVAIPEIEVVLVGALDPGMNSLLAPYIGAFRHAGVVARSLLSEFYSQASVLVLPSVEEGLALVMAQAMACGLPVIATSNTGAEDLFTDGAQGFIVPIRSPTAIAEKLAYLYENPDAREMMGAAALERVRSISGWDSYGAKMAACYEEALAHRPGRISAA